MNYYNEFNPKAAAALRGLIADGFIPKGIVDERSITEVQPGDLQGFTQCHFFAGIGGWSLALHLAEWPADRPVWTGSCPCQPFSSAGKQKGKADERHLWPVWARLISECKPATIFGEQVSTAIAHGWFDDVADDLESQGYAVGAAVLPACSVGAPHKRDRLWFVADCYEQRCDREQISIRQKQEKNFETRWSGRSGNVADTASQRLPPQRQWHLQQEFTKQNKSPMDYTQQQGLEGHSWNDSTTQRWQEPLRPVAEADFWHTGQWIDCPDGKQRLIEPTIQLLVDGFPERVGLLHAAGNAIVAQVAAQFIKASQ